MSDRGDGGDRLAEIVHLAVLRMAGDPGHGFHLALLYRIKEALVKVRLTDENGVSWMVAYTLELQKNKEWLISGCHIQGEQGTFV